jgi:hypothetical protein
MLNLVELSNLNFENEACRNPNSNVEFASLDGSWVLWALPSGRSVAVGQGILVVFGADRVNTLIEIAEENARTVLSFFGERLQGRSSSDANVRVPVAKAGEIGSDGSE